MNWMAKFLGRNWKTTLAGVVTFLMGVPQFYSAFQSWMAGGHPDWRGAFGSVVVSVGLLAAKDSTTHSTANEVQASTIEK